ncbi:potassium channel family protein [Nocardiopsis changdeensis]|uniref:potassium channel family protein n=1 Tax=Nocardiopsis changdeensis TaxID=2831969 RepID=UPI003F477B18
MAEQDTPLQPLEHDARVTRWERRAEIPMLLLAVAFLVAYAWPVIDPGLEPDLYNVLQALSWTVWLSFTVDFAIRIHLSDHRLQYALRNWYDVVLVLVLLPMFRMLRRFSLVRMLNRSTVGHSMIGKTSVYVTGAAALMVFLSAVTVLDAERGAPDANITEFGDALWWAIVTAATVGYGDFYPVTLEGRLVAVVLMIMGVGLMGVVTAAVASGS